MPETNEKIQIYGLDEGPLQRGAGRNDIKYRRGEVTPEELRDRIHAFLEKMQTVVQGLPGWLGSYKVETVTLCIEVSAKGTISLLGTGGEIGGKGGLTLSLKKAGTAEGSLIVATAGNNASTPPPSSDAGA